MTRDVLYSNGVIETVETIRVCRPVSLSGVGAADDLIFFDQQIAWLIEQRAHVDALHGDVVIRTVGGYVDAGRFGAAVLSAVEEAESFSRWCGVDQTSTLVVTGKAWHERIPVLVTPESTVHGIFHRRDYQLPAADWFVDEAAARDWIAAQGGNHDVDWERIQAGRLRQDQPVVLNEAVVFCSAWDATANKAAFDAYKALTERMRAGNFGRLTAIPAPAAG